MKFKRIQILPVLLFLLSGAAAQAEPLQIPSIDVVPIKDKASDRDYELYIKLPEDYDPEGEKTHPVIYLADALWHIEIFSGSIEYIVPDAILVGVSWEKGIPPQRSRMRDYMPSKYTGTDYEHPTGMASEHLAFIKNEVFTHVESEYKADPGQRTYFGFSASGTFGSYILLTQPDTFANYILGSPATLFHDHFVHEYEPIAEVIPETIHANIFVTVGSDENADAISHAIALVQFLKSRKSEKSKLEFSVIESANHGQAFPATAMQSIYWLARISE